MRQTPLFQLVAVKLGRDLRDYVVAARAEGRDWRGIAEDLHTATGVYVSHETVRSWFLDELCAIGGAA